MLTLGETLRLGSVLVLLICLFSLGAWLNDVPSLMLLSPFVAIILGAATPFFFAMGVLAKEGTAMRHCVAMYKQPCVNGTTSIWTVTANKARALTIRVNNATSKIVEYRGLANRPPRPTEVNVVKAWARDAGLSVW